MRYVRRCLLGAVFGLWLLMGCEQQAPEIPEPSETVYVGTILALGDSLTEGYGLAEQDAYPALLQQRLLADGHRYRVVNAGISGETTSGLRTRIDWALTLNPDIVIIETGANDALRGIDPTLIKDNLDAIIVALKERNIITVLTGMRIYTNLGRDYADRFEKIYPNLATAHDLIYMPFFLKAVAGNRRLNLEDGMHPTKDGYGVVLKHLYPYVLEAIRRVKKE